MLNYMSNEVGTIISEFETQNIHKRQKSGFPRTWLLMDDRGLHCVPLPPLMP